MQLFYANTIKPNQKEYTFDKNESRHIVRVLRKNTNDFLHITNGLGYLFTCKITSANDKKCTVQIIQAEQKEKTNKHHTHIAIAPTKLNDRLEWFLEKATEIGIDEITPIICQHSERKVIKPERMQKIIQAAAKQSLKYHFPILNQATTFATFVNQKHNSNLFIAHCEETSKKLLKSVVKPNTKNTILIGPEGDFSTSEIQQAIQKGAIPITLGNNRLRTETAGIVALHTITLINQ